MTKSTHPQVLKLRGRSLPEQLIGLGIITFISLSFAVLNTFLMDIGNSWYATLRCASWSLSTEVHTVCSTAAYLALAFSFWSIWRLYSLRKLHLELSLFLAAFFFGGLWSVSLYVIHEPLLALVAILLWMSEIIGLTALFWRKEKSAGYFGLVTLCWTLYLLSTTIMLCITNN